MRKEDIWEEQRALVRHLERTLNCIEKLASGHIPGSDKTWVFEGKKFKVDFDIVDALNVLTMEAASTVATLEMYQIPGMMERLEKAEEDIKAGRIRPFEELVEELKLKQEKKRKEKDGD